MMLSKIIDWLKQYIWVAIIILALAFVFGQFFDIYQLEKKTEQLEKVKTSRFIGYTTDGEMVPIDGNIMIDKETGVQYLVTTNGLFGYEITPLVDQYGMPYTTVE